MGRKMLIFVSDDNMATQQARSFAENNGAEFHGFTTSEWRYNLEDPKFREKVMDGVPSLVSGSAVVEGGAKILPFPNQQVSSAHSSSNNQVGPVKTINELESIAIENAIQEFNGNLTEAAKALGIGRATLYRKVKLYGIKASRERKKMVA
ncbi:MAG: hypothetical protein KDD61_18235 [Bdellovibrionales bacterium]|nr:hypothetical protein [Bdellovibrionales bacterium]